MNNDEQLWHLRPRGDRFHRPAWPVHASDDLGGRRLQRRRASSSAGYGTPCSLRPTSTPGICPDCTRGTWPSACR